MSAMSGEVRRTVYTYVDTDEFGKDAVKVPHELYQMLGALLD